MAAVASTTFTAKPSWVSRVLDTADDRVALGLRLLLAAVIFPHGAQHLLGWFGGYGFTGTSGWMVQNVGVPAAVAGFAIVFELVAPIALALGLFGRPIALGLAVFMGVAASTHAANGFFMNWFGKQPGEGFEYHLLAIGIALALAARGSGAFSLDRRLMLR